MVENKNQLLKMIYQAGLAVDDMILYLDTHPCDQEALAYYYHMRDLYLDAVSAYQAQCGPLVAVHNSPGSYWCWAQDPWPWEGGAS